MWRDRVTGMGCGRWDLPWEAHEQLEELVRAVRTADAADCEPDERRTPEQATADAFMDVIDRASAAADLPTVRGRKPDLTVTVEAEALLGADGRPATRGGVTRRGVRLSDDLVARLACDAVLTRAVLTATGKVLDIGRSSRTWTAAQHRAAEITFGGCAFPVGDGRMCGRPFAWTDLHHVTWWRHGGRTDQCNGVPLCRHHHTVVHHGGWELLYDHERQLLQVRHRRRDGTLLVRSVDLRRPAASAPSSLLA
jgi:hypothetical protein